MGILIAVVCGVILGSFLSVLIERWPHWRGVVSGRSHCPHCSHVLAWNDLIPLVSWVLARGTCRYCHVPISKLYPVLEVTMAAVLGIYAALYGVPSSWFVLDYLILFLLVALFFLDLRHLVLPDTLLAVLGSIVGIRLVLLRPDILLNAGAMGALLCGSLWLLYIVSHGRWLGFGDVKLAAVIGLLFGFPQAIGVTLIAIWAGALVGVGMIVRKKATMQTALPFGSFWTAAAIVTMMVPGWVGYLSGLFTPVL